MDTELTSSILPDNPPIPARWKHFVTIPLLPKLLSKYQTNVPMIPNLDREILGEALRGNL